MLQEAPSSANISSNGYFVYANPGKSPFPKVFDL